MSKNKTKGDKKSKKDDAMDLEPSQTTADEQDPIDLSQLMRENISILLRAIELDDRNLVRRVWRRNTAVRKDLSLIDFQDILIANVPAGNSRNKILSKLDVLLKISPISQSANTKSKGVKGGKVEKNEGNVVEPLLEVESYLHLFVIARLMMHKKYDEVIDSCNFQLQNLKKENRQTLDSFVSKLYTYMSLAYERSGKTTGAESEAELLNILISAHRTACLRLYEHSQGTLINLILRFYIRTKNYATASVFDSKAIFPEESSNVPNNETVRYLFHTAKILSVQGDYSRCEQLTTRALRKFPSTTSGTQNITGILCFKSDLSKLNILGKLLTGEVPERIMFSDKQLAAELKPYFYLTKSVRNGSVAEYERVLKEHGVKFEKDDTLSLVLRLRSSVIKTGLRNINKAYSKISFAQVAAQLQLSAESGAELLCAKAIRDGTITNAFLDPSAKALISYNSEQIGTAGIGATLEPTEAFDQRIKFCLGVYNQAMKAHKYPPNSHKAKHETSKKGAGGGTDGNENEAQAVADADDDNLDDFLGDM